MLSIGSALNAFARALASRTRASSRARAVCRSAIAAATFLCCSSRRFAAARQSHAQPIARSSAFAATSEMTRS